MSASSARPQRSRISKSNAVERRQKAVPRDRRRARLERKRQPAPHHVRRGGIEQHGDHFACRARAEPGERRHDRAHDAISRQQLHEGTDDERIARRVAQRGANPQEVSGTELDDGGDHRIGGRGGRLDRVREIRGLAEPLPDRDRPCFLTTVKSAIEVLDRLLEVLALAPEPSFEGADVSRPESARDEELAGGRDRHGEIHRRKGMRRGEAHQQEDQQRARALSSAIDSATSMIDLADRFVASASGV